MSRPKSTPILFGRQDNRKLYIIPIEYIGTIVLLGELSTWPREISLSEADRVTIDIVADPAVLDLIVMPLGPLRSLATAILELDVRDLATASKLWSSTVQPRITVWGPSQLVVFGQRREAA